MDASQPERSLAFFPPGSEMQEHDSQHSPSSLFSEEPRNEANSASSSKSPSQSPPNGGSSQGRGASPAPPAGVARTAANNGSARKRVYRACEVCRRKKVKCNGKKPCGHCITFVEECHYADTRDRTAYSRRYVESLEQRLAKMEQAFLMASPEQRSSFNDNLRALSKIQGQSSELLLRQNATNENPEEILKEHQAEGPAGQVCTARKHYSGTLRPDENQNLRYIGPSSAVALIAEASEALDSPFGRRTERVTVTNTHRDAPWFGMTFGPSVARIVLSDPEAELPARSICDHLVQAFFDRVHPIFPVLSQGRFLAGFETLFSPHAASVEIDVAFLAILFAVLACGERVTSQPEPEDAQNFQWSGVPPTHAALRHRNVAPGSRFYTRSYSLGMRCTSEARLDVVQLYALQAYYLSASNFSARAWIQTGHAMRLSLDLGLQRNLIHVTLPEDEREARRRVWWCVYMLDRLLGINIGRPFGVEDDQIDAQLPQGELGPLMPLMPGFAALISLSRTAGRIARTVARLQQARSQADVNDEAASLRSARALEEALGAWHESLPEALRNTKMNPDDPLAVQSCIAISCLNSARLHLQQAILRDPSQRQCTSSTEEEKMDLARCTQTALHIIRGAHRVARMIPPSHYLLDFSHQLLVAGGFLALNAATRRHANAFQLLNEAEEAINGFRHMEAIFPSSCDHRKTLGRIVRSVRERLGMLPRGYAHRTAARTPPLLERASETTAVQAKRRSTETNREMQRDDSTGTAMAEKRRRCSNVDMREAPSLDTNAAVSLASLLPSTPCAMPWDWNPAVPPFDAQAATCFSNSVAAPLEIPRNPVPRISAEPVQHQQQAQQTQPPQQHDAGLVVNSTASASVTSPCSFYLPMFNLDFACEEHASAQGTQRFRNLDTEHGNLLGIQLEADLHPSLE